MQQWPITSAVATPKDAGPYAMPMPHLNWRRCFSWRRQLNFHLRCHPASPLRHSRTSNVWFRPSPTGAMSRSSGNNSQRRPAWPGWLQRHARFLPLNWFSNRRPGPGCCAYGQQKQLRVSLSTKYRRCAANAWAPCFQRRQSRDLTGN